MSRVKWVLPRKFAELTGYTEEAVIQAPEDLEEAARYIYKHGGGGTTEATQEQ